MFAITFLSREPELQEGYAPALWGLITLGEYRERFLAPVDKWNPEQYQHEWRQAAERLLRGESAAFVTAPWQSWWAMWPEGEDVVVQEHLLTPEGLAWLAPDLASLVGRVHHEFVGLRHTHTEDGDPISEWQVRLTDVRQWLYSTFPSSAAKRDAAGDVRPDI